MIKTVLKLSLMLLIKYLSDNEVKPMALAKYGKYVQYEQLLKDTFLW